MMQRFASATASRSVTLAGLVTLAVLALGQSAQVHADPGDGQGTKTLNYTTGMHASGHNVKMYIHYQGIGEHGEPVWKPVQGNGQQMQDQPIPGMPGMSGYKGTVTGLYSGVNYRFYAYCHDDQELVEGVGFITFP